MESVRTNLEPGSPDRWRDQWLIIRQITTTVISIMDESAGLAWWWWRQVSATPTERSAVWGCDGVARSRARTVCMQMVFFLPSRSLPRWRRWTRPPRGEENGRTAGRKEGMEAGTLKCRRSLRASNLREESFYDTTAAALHSAAAVTDRFGERLEQASLV